MDGIIVFQDGHCDVFVKYQDGVEITSDVASLDEAKKVWKKGHLDWNHTRRKVSEVEIYDVVSVSTSKLVKRGK